MNNPNPSDVSEYIEIKYNWYDNRSISCKRRFSILAIFDITLSGFIPFVTLFLSTSIYAQYIIAFMGCLITILSGIQTTFRFYDNWIKYRRIAQELDNLRNINEYDHKLTFEQVNAIIEKENRDWLKLRLDKNQKIHSNN
ncbi:MAG: DUF4231 domain-containing protein [Vallitalea sp.]|jgi:predicted membrane metal-binding protein|nr:DUF4231 domain-containing protein [Vallitalea sp.]